jgi:hypothetical protein
MNSSADDFRTMIKPPTLLLVLSGAAQGTRIAVPLGGLVIGRSGSPDGRLGDDPALSRQHAVIVHSDRGELVVSDLGSTNGTFLNGSRVEGSALVRPGDTIELGNTKLKAIGPSPAASPATAQASPGGAQSPPPPAHPAAAPPAHPAAPAAAAPAQVPAAVAHPATPPAAAPHQAVAPSAAPHPAVAPSAAPHPAAPVAAAPSAHPAAPAAAAHPAAAPVPAAAPAHAAASPAAAPAHAAASPAAAVPAQVPPVPPAHPAAPPVAAPPHPGAAPAQAAPPQMRPAAGPVAGAAGRFQTPGARQTSPAGSPPVPSPHAPSADVVAEAVYEAARQQWRRLVSRFSAVAGYVALIALLGGLVVMAVMMTHR